MLIGIANIIPGVSGGTLAVALNIFDDMINAINNLKKNFFASSKFLVPIIFGAAFSILAFSSVLDFCLKNYSLITSMFFVGLVGGSSKFIYKRAIEKNTGKFYLIWVLISCCVIFLISSLNNNSNLEINNQVSFLFLIKIFLGGILAAAAMITPGISGSFIMILLGIYPTVINALSNIQKITISQINIPRNILLANFLILFALALGVIIGILVISRLIAFLLKKFYSQTYFVILGLLLASTYGIFMSPITYQSKITKFSIIFSLLSCTIGALISIAIGDDKK